ncbi:Hypothetical protein A7982_07314 [Minicystis rosea]|nr:Hypothetical protein A7982_07314 [Minicystis rosea]
MVRTLETVARTPTATLTGTGCTLARILASSFALEAFDPRYAVPCAEQARSRASSSSRDADEPKAPSLPRIAAKDRGPLSR